ncbi:MAG TPA: sulfatase-like hydrolase/transferase, partial [Pseudomonadales bacterium]
RKLLVALVVLVIAGAVAWQNRIELLVWGAPKLRAALNPVPENVPTRWAVGPAEAEAPPAERPPNIIVILTDDMGFNDISLYNGGAGDGSVMTPSIDAIAQQGVRFMNGYSANAVCAPSRASIMTGRYSTRFGFEFTPFPRIGATIFSWMQELDPKPLPSFIDMEALDRLPGEDLGDLGMPAEEVTIAEVLKAAGYYTAHIGKWHLGSSNGMRPEEQGFDDSLYMAGMLYLPEDHPDVVNAKREEDSIERMVWTTAEYAAQFNGGERFQPDGYLTDYYTREALKVIENNRNRPFFLYLAHWGIHNPLQALRSDYEALAHIEDHHLRVYSAMIRSVDRSVGAVQAKLEELGLAENTLILFTSDNGGAGYIQLPDVNRPYRGWKLTHFEGGTHVPFMASWPSRIRAGSLMNAPVHHIDLFHTIAAAAGADVPTDRKLDGVDLLPFVTGEATGSPHETLFWREGHHQSVQHQGWKLIRAARPDKRWLFNLIVDPTEQVNLAARRPEKVAELEALLDAHNAEQAQPLWPSITESPQLIDKHGGQPYEEGDEYIYWPN